MSDNDNNGTPVKGSANKSGWTDRELLVYLFGLVEYSKVKLDIKNAPRPAGRTVRGCEQKIQGLKNMLRAELEALRSGDPIDSGNAMPTPKKNGRKRKGDDEANGNADGSPRKRGNCKKKAEVEAEEQELQAFVKTEIKDELDIEDEV